MSFVNDAHVASADVINYAPVAGNTVVIAVGAFLGTGTPVASLKDNLGNSYGVALATTQGGSSGYLLSVFEGVAPAGVTSFTVTWTGGAVSGGVALEILLLEYSAISHYIGASAFNYVTGPGTAANAIATSALNVTPTPADLVVFVFNPAQNTCTAGTSPNTFTARYASAGSGLFGEDAHLTSAGSTTGTATTANAANNFLTVALAFADGSQIAGGAAASTSAAATLATAIQNAGSAMVSEAAVAALTNWATVTLVAPLYTGTGGILDPNFWLDETPVAGTTLYYDATNITIYANGEISSTTNNCSAVVQFFDGIAWSIGLVILTPQMVSYAHVVSAAVGALTTGITFAGAALTSSSVAGGLSTGVLLAANAIAVSNAAASLLTEVQMNAAALTNVAATAALTGGVASLQGQASVLTQSIAALTAKIQLAGQVAVNSQVVGALTAQILFQGAANALTQAQGQLTTAIQLAGNVNVASTAAGAALISSQFAGAVNLVSTAMGSLSTGLLVAGTALVTVQAGGALSTGVQLAGGAVIDTEAAFTPPGVTGQFGYAQINVLSPTGLPVAQATFIEGSACIVTIDYFNALGAPFDPNAVSYQVSDVVSGAVLVPFTPVPGAPDLSNAITITGAQNTMVNNSRTSELHQVVFEITDGTGNVSVASAMFELIRLSGLN